MNKTIKRMGQMAVLVAAISAVVTGCGGNKKEIQGEKTGEKLSVMASFYPVYDFAQKVGQDKVNVTNMVPAGTEPHEWEPATSDITRLEKADVFVYSGAGMEHWTDTVLKSLENKELISVEASQGISLHKGHEEEEAEEEAGEEEHEHGAYDPHVWLSPMNAKKEMENIKDAFVKADPKNKDYYETNYQTYAEKFDQLDQTYKETLTPLPNKVVVVSHEAFGYLCSSYGLTQMGIEGLSPDSEPDPARMAQVIDFVNKNHIETIFFEELVSPKVAETIANETGANTQVLNPLEGLTDEELKDGADYFSVMEKNLAVLKKALE
ncbi:metal ABC transporter substrate-binding protein [Clostridium sp. E02]|uniref:metal ABC transporter substrate-binding protein n=1 Tax=Clostridium sp. E02 TaxID=2487134 RepID=UPI000F5211E2|nr:metal ABC transporter substrate-binding protein [Clostridium sp. E02]